MAKKETKFDVQGFEIVTKAIQSLLDGFPGLYEGDRIAFSTIGKESGIAWYPVRGGVIDDETEDILGHVTQLCSYPFYVVYRAGGTSSERKVGIKEFLDSLGCYLEKQPIQVGEETYVLEEYPSLTDGRIIKEISRQTPAFLNQAYENGVEDWEIAITLKYQNEFDR